MTFEETFAKHILNQKVVEWGFKKLYSFRLPNGFSQDIGGYYTKYENGYSMICNGENLGSTPIQEAIILDPEGMPIARDTEDLV